MVSYLSKHLIIIFSFCVFGCASVPNTAFEKESSLLSTASYQEKLIHCGDYHVLSVKRPIFLKPFVTCVKEASQQESGVISEDFLLFQKELELQYNLLRESYWNKQTGLQMEVAIKALLRTFWVLPGKTGKYTVQEKYLIRQHFPLTARRIGVSGWPTATQIVIDPALEKLKAGFAALFNKYSSAQVFASKDSSNTYLVRCNQVKKLEIDIDNLEEFWPRLSESYKTRLAQLQHKLEFLQKEASFNASSCGVFTVSNFSQS
ncbi:MAG: hypothetical protein A3K03_02555 [Bdellovibrionales bacterium RIFOXYD1_FULL_44_7]|nr:MAG: hypothetical protein A3K03_02555 [Bdellovibrionales bacterium RIFOXYD1_FULL_44_7]